jgi:hypothetical protein
VFKAFSPWRALARAVAWMAGRVGASSPAPLKYPARLGRWPAAATIVAFAWLELVYVNKAVPSTLAWLATAYAVVQLVGMSLYGIEQWTERADGFGVYFGVIGRLAPLARRGRELLLRRPLEGATTLEVVPGTVALMCAVIGSTTFDGFSNGPIWNNLVPHLESFFSKLGLGFQAASEAGASLGLVVCISIVAVIYQLGVRGMRSVGGGLSAKTLAGAFAHSLAPIALAYIVAHYFSLLAYQGQSLAYLASDPLGHGSDLFGTAHDTINYGVINSTGIWYVQVGALILGHVGGLVLAHDRALTLYSDSRQATRSQGWMLTVMVGFTSLGLWLISSVNA